MYFDHSFTYHLKFEWMSGVLLEKNKTGVIDMKNVLKSKFDFTKYGNLKELFWILLFSPRSNFQKNNHEPCGD